MVDPGHLLRVEVACDEGAPGRVRQAIEQLSEIEPVRDDALLVASELVTNAVKHSGSARGEPIEVELSLQDSRLVIAVHDFGAAAGPVRPRTPGPGGGWGLRVVSELAQRWGAEPLGGHRVWAELAL